jgi:5'-nucleotidase
MKIILTNDDGIDAPGLSALRNVCAAWGEIFVVAPNECHSSMSHRVTTTEPIPVAEENPNRYRVTGTPADCARLALKCLVPDAGWVISGINRGGNLGADTYLSGTVAAAREAALLGVPAIAISHYVARGRAVNWAAAQRRAALALAHAMENPPRAGQFWNINLPHPGDDAEECELSLCPLDYGPHAVRFEKVGSCYRYCGDYHLRPTVPGHDVAECFSGKIAATLIPVQFAEIR